MPNVGSKRSLPLPPAGWPALHPIALGYGRGQRCGRSLRSSQRGLAGAEGRWWSPRSAVQPEHGHRFLGHGVPCRIGRPALCPHLARMRQAFGVGLVRAERRGLAPSLNGLSMRLPAAVGPALGELLMDAGSSICGCFWAPECSWLAAGCFGACWAAMDGPDRGATRIVARAILRTPFRISQGAPPVPAPRFGGAPVTSGTPPLDWASSADLRWPMMGFPQ